VKVIQRENAMQRTRLMVNTLAVKVVATDAVILITTHRTVMQKKIDGETVFNESLSKQPIGKKKIKNLSKEKQIKIKIIGVLLS
jgi:hypothetical protein